MPIIPPSLLSRRAAAGMGLILLGTAAFLVLRYPALPDLLPVHFNRSGVPDGWQYRTVGRVLMPLFVQLALASSLGAIAALLLSRSTGDVRADEPDVRAASAAADTVLGIAFVWVSFQAYAAFALTQMWMAGRGGLGPAYTALEVVGLVLTVGVAVRGHSGIGKPVSRPFVPGHWRFSQLYRNPDDPALFVPTRDGRRWTLNFGRPVAAALLGAIILLGVVMPTVILVLALRFEF